MARRKMQAALSALAAVTAGAAGSLTMAATIDEDALEVTRSDGRYSLAAEAHLAATPESIYDVLMDYDDNAYGRISSVYKESRYLDPAPDGTPIVYTRLEGCLLRFLCLSLCRTERLESIEPRWIKSSVLPERSNFKHSTSEWALESDGNGGTKMKFRLEMEPDFWLPPIIGPRILERTLERGGVNAVRRIERLARIRDGRAVEYVPPPGSGRTVRSPDDEPEERRSSCGDAGEAEAEAAVAAADARDEAKTDAGAEPGATQASR
jgi:hypothetical protein